MPRYFFNLFNSETLRDDCGEVFPDAVAAHAAAVRAISELIADQMIAGTKVNLSHRLEIEDESRQMVERIVFGDLFCAICPTPGGRPST